ncbi:MAG TPA: SRPBCC domain-containing protein [Gemmatimonadales bacterium]|nr:SRPBCC domain-containing protein [Gemmatimonadales bacterium]
MEPLKDHVLSIDIMVPVQKVWDEITKLGRVQRALMNTVLESTLVPGAKLRYYSTDKKRVFVVGEVVEVAPPRRFTHTYMFTQRPEKPSLVTWELAEIPGGCRVTLTHGGWTDQVKTHKSVVGGWRQILAVLKTELETGDIPLGTKIMYGLMSAFMFMMPRSTRTEEVARAGW